MSRINTNKTKYINRKKATGFMKRNKNKPSCEKKAYLLL